MHVHTNTHTHHLLLHSLHNALGLFNIALYHLRVSLGNILTAKVKLRERGGGGGERGREKEEKEGGKQGWRQEKKGAREK